MLEIAIMNKNNISKLADILKKDTYVEFTYNNLFYEIFESANGGYMVNLYSSNEKDEDGCFLDENIIDGGLCTGSASDAVWFMVWKEELKMDTNFEEIIPQKVLFSIKEISDLGIIKSDMCKKLIYNRKIEVVKLGTKNFIARAEVIRYLKSRTISALNFIDIQKLSA